MIRKDTITKDNYKEIVLKRAIIVCWVLLAICFVIKLCGGNFFNIVCNNGEFIAFCEYVNNSFIRYIIYYITFVFTSLMLLFIDIPKIKNNKKDVAIYIVVISIVWIIKLIVEIYCNCSNLAIYNIIILCAMFLVLLCFSKKPIASIIVVAYDFILSLLSALLKNINLIEGITEYFIVDIIFLIDYYIMLTITMLYREINFRRRS